MTAARRIALALSLACVAGLGLPACRAETALESAAPHTAPRRGMVVCEHPIAAEVGVEILERNGNAVDAAIATAFALAVVYPQAGNLGGGGFAVVVGVGEDPFAIDFRETAPKGTSVDAYLDGDGRPRPGLLRSGPLSVGVPGTPAGLWELYQRGGSTRIAWSELVAPAIRLAREGFAVDAVLAADLGRESSRARLAESQGARARFYPDGRPLQEGELLVQRELAETLQLIARQGPDGFYRGVTAKRIVNELAYVAESAGLTTGWITAEDLRDYQTKERRPLRGWFRGKEIITMPPPSSGGVILLQVLSVLDGFPLDAERRASLSDRSESAVAAEAGRVDADAAGLNARIVHWWIEALRRSFAARATQMGDPDFFSVPVQELLSPKWIAASRLSIGETHRDEMVGPPVPEGSDTTHVSVLDDRGNAVSLTTTLNGRFGSGTLVRGAGFLLNNELDDFSLGLDVPNQYDLVGGGVANRIEPGKRPLSSMTPTIVRDGGHTVSFVLGSPGGPRIITSVIAVLLRTLVFEQPLAEAIAAPRFHQQWSPSATEFEPGWPPGLIEAVRRRGQPVEEKGETWSSVQAIRVFPDGRVVGASDPRRGGAALGTQAQ